MSERPIAIEVACTEEEAGPLREVILRAYEDAKGRGWPFLSDVLEGAGKGLEEEERAVVAAAVHALTRYERLTGFVAKRRDAGERLDQLFALAKKDSPEARDALARLERVESATERLAIRYSFPDWIAQVVGDEALLARMNETPPRVARVNTLRTTREACLNALDDEGVTAYATKQAAQGIVFEGRRSPFRTKPFARGEFEMQDEASQLVAELVAPPPKSFVVDACAGAGGKTLALAAGLGGKGKLLAIDPSKSSHTRCSREAGKAEVRDEKVPSAWKWDCGSRGAFDFVRRHGRLHVSRGRRHVAVRVGVGRGWNCPLFDRLERRHRMRDGRRRRWSALGLLLGR